MSSASVLLTIALLWFATAVAPGPNFVVTTRTAVLHDRATGVRTERNFCRGCTRMHAGKIGTNALSERIIGCAFRVLDTLGACINYLKATDLELCLLLNFSRPRLEIHRVAHEL